MADIPVGVAVGHVTGHFDRALPDSADPGTRPDMLPLEGTATLRPLIDYLRFPALTPQRFLELPSVQVAITAGVVTDDQGASGVDLVASFQAPNGEPDYFQWEATIEFSNSSLRIAPFRFEVIPDQTVDLASYVPTARSSAIQTVVNSQDRILAEQAAADAQAIADSLSAGVGPMVEEYLIAHPPVGTGISSWNDLLDKPTTFPPASHTQDISTVTGFSALGRDIALATTGSGVRDLIGAGNSNLGIGTTAGTAMEGNRTFAIGEITGLVAPITTFLGATTQLAARTAIGATALQIGTSSTTAMRGDKTWTSAEITDATTLGRNLLTAATAGAALALIGGAPLASPTFTGTVSGITKTMVGLGNVDNTSDLNKPISLAQQVVNDALPADVIEIVTPALNSKITINDHDPQIDVRATAGSARSADLDNSRPTLVFVEA